MLAAGRMNVVDDNQILGVLVPLFGVIPERAAVQILRLDELAGLVEEHIMPRGWNFVSSNCCSQSMRASLTAFSSHSTSLRKRLRQDWSEALGISSVIPATVLLCEIIKPVK